MERREFNPTLHALLGSNHVNWDALPQSSNLSECLHDFRVIDVYGSNTAGQDGKQQKARVIVALQVLAPADAAGTIHEEGFTVGTDADPAAMNLATLESRSNFGAIALTNLRRHLGAATPLAMIGGEFSAYIRNTPNGDRSYSNLVTTAFYKPGAIAPGTTTTPTPQRGRMRPQTQAQTAAPSNGTLEMPCPMCQVMTKVSELPEHIASCTGAPAQSV